MLIRRGMMPDGRIADHPGRRANRRYHRPPRAAGLRAGGRCRRRCGTAGTSRPSPAPAGDGRRARLAHGRAAAGTDRNATGTGAEDGRTRSRRLDPRGRLPRIGCRRTGSRPTRRAHRRYTRTGAAPQRCDVDSELRRAGGRRPHRPSRRQAAQRRRLGGRTTAAGDGVSRDHRSPRRVMASPESPTPHRI